MPRSAFARTSAFDGELLRLEPGFEATVGMLGPDREDSVASKRLVRPLQCFSPVEGMLQIDVRVMGALVQIEHDRVVHGPPGGGLADQAGHVGDVELHSRIGDGHVGQVGQRAAAPLHDDRIELGNSHAGIGREAVQGSAKRETHAQAGDQDPRCHRAMEGDACTPAQGGFAEVTVTAHQDVRRHADHILVAATHKGHQALLRLGSRQGLPRSWHGAVVAELGDDCEWRGAALERCYDRSMARVDDPYDETTQAGQYRALILLRLTLVVATGYLLLAEYGLRGFPWALALLLVLAASSNILVVVLPGRFVRSSVFSAGLILFDTLAITVALLFSGRFTAEFFYLYFLILIVAAIGESLRMIVLGAVVIGISYLVFLIHRQGFAELWTVSSLVRIPFLFAVASFYGYLVDRLRREREEMQRERLLVERLQEHQTVLEEANRRLAREIDERERAEDALVRANDELQRVAELKTAFVSTVSHELRTPLTAIKNACSLMVRSKALADGSPEHRFLEIIERNTERQLGIINDLLDLSKIEAGKLPMDCRSCVLTSLIQGIVTSCEPLARTNEQTIELEVEPDLPSVWIEAQRIEQVLTNLLSNAFKFSPPRTAVVITAVQRRDDEVEISVRDRGSGLSEEDRDRVFEPFYQVGDAVTGKKKGTGLGLPISRDLVRAHGFELSVEPAPGGGSTFSFTVPIDSDVGHERVAFETEVRKARSYPFFCVVAVKAGAAGVAKTAAVLEKLLPRSSDQVVAQPAHGRVLIILLGTPGHGGEVVAARLRGQLVDPELSADVCGVAEYPEDGVYGGRLVDVALAGRKKEQLPAGGG